MQCPCCYKLDYYTTYANGTWIEGYCQLCSYESREPTTKRDKIPFIVVERPKNRQDRQDRIKRNK